MKCPEQRPMCARCQRLGLDCRYLPLKSKHNDMGHYEKRTRQILPATATKLCMMPSSLQQSYCNLEPGASIYFDFFRDQVTLMDQDVEMTDFWLRTVLRASHRDESITYATTAIGALARTRKHSGGPCFRDPDLPNQEGSVHYCAAIKYYNKAIAAFRRYMASSKSEDANRTILIITVLFVIFEILHGNNRAADALTATGILLLKDKILHSVSVSGASRSSLAGLIDDQGVVEAELFLTRSATICSKASYLAPYAHADGRKALLMIPSSGLNIPRPPSADANIKTFALQYLNAVALILIWHTRVRAHKQMGIYNHPECSRQQKNLLNGLTRWIEAFEAQLKKRHAIHVLHYLEWQLILTKFAYVIVYCELDPTGSLWESMGPYCAELIPRFRAHLDAELMNQSRPGGSLISIDTTSMWGIFVTAGINVATECRNRSVRLALIDLCKIATKDSFLQHLHLRVMATALFIDAEEEGRDNAGVLPMSSRYDPEIAIVSIPPD
jgi:Fungal Zn(2)-Cys(6) binuclear cluster domain